MTIFGKIMAIFVFLLSLVWFGLTVNLYATRAEWRKAYEKARDEAQKNATDTDELKKQLQLERANVAGRQLSADQSVKAIAAQLKTKESENEQLKNAVNVAQDNSAKLMPTIKEYDATIQKLQKQVSDLTTENAAVTKARDEYATRAQNAENRMTNAELQVKTYAAANETLSEKIRQLSERRAAADLGGEGTSFRGDVKAVSEGGSLISFSGGLNAGVKKDAKYKVLRNSAPYFVGTVTVTNVDTQVSAGLFTPAAGTTPAGEYVPRVGDLVESK